MNTNIVVYIYFPVRCTFSNRAEHTEKMNIKCCFTVVSVSGCHGNDFGVVGDATSGKHIHIHIKTAHAIALNFLYLCTVLNMVEF